jgi:hypothetical protein
VVGVGKIGNVSGGSVYVMIAAAPSIDFSAGLSFFAQAFTLHLLFQYSKRLVDVVVAH